MTHRTQIEKSLSALHALLGESTEAAAAVDIMRDLTSGHAEPGADVPRLEAAACYCIDRIALAIERMRNQEHGKGYDCAMADVRAAEDAEQAESDPRDDMDGDHASALKSVYGPDNDGEG